ncbi:hypothetical protein N6B72_05200 [Chryseobacterium soli]|uniref:DUF6705 family protein n=1 Tax=Chryseobacterium soli TaxID=445961 RepID=UPI002953FFF5|nr:DUF6705 family protein [Chryseobacterium soli]MDV7696312.1 hypothetical protein [Chryseobacterium soli]
MKKLLYILLIFISISVLGQEYPLGTNPSDLPAYSYIKDTNNEYNKYVGIWKGNWNGKTVYLELKKIKYNKNYSTPPYYVDKILGERKIIATNGTVEIDRISNFDYQDPEIFGTGLPTQVNGVNYPSLMFYPKNMCDKFARLVVTNITTTQMTLHFVYEPSAYKENCIHNAYVDQNGGDFPVNFPKDIVLTKQ